MFKKFVVLLLSLFSIQALAFEVQLDSSSRYVEVSSGSVKYSTSDDFLNIGQFDSPMGFNVAVGMHLSGKSADSQSDYADRGNHYVSLEGFYHYLGKSESELVVGGETRTGAIEVSGFGAALKVARALDDEVHLYTKLGVMMWSADGSQAINNVEDPECCSDDGIDTFIGVGLSYRVYNYGLIKGEIAALPLGLEGDDVHLSTFTLGIGYYF